MSLPLEAREEDVLIDDEEPGTFSGEENEFDGDDEDEGMAASGTSNEVHSRSEKGKRRKRTDPTKRKKIRRIMRDEELTEETLAAQSEERERLRRLELQRSLTTTELAARSPRSQTPGCDALTPVDSARDVLPLVVDVRMKNKPSPSVIVIESDEDESAPLEGHALVQSTSKGRPAVVGECIEIVSSDSEVEAVEGSDDSDYDNCGKHVDDLVNSPDSQGRVLVNLGHPADEDDIFLRPQLAQAVKPHQIGGIRFLYDNLVETTSRYKVSNGFGCILAHSMGLGKTLQVISFIDALLSHTPARKVLCVVPINTIQNWLAEFNLWLPPKPVTVLNDGEESDGDLPESTCFRDFKVFLLGDSHKTTLARAKVIGEWRQQGGVLLMGYELYRLLALATPNLATSKNLSSFKKKKSGAAGKEPEVVDLDEEEQQMELLIGIQRALCKPGPDVVICDEGHRIKNPQANISHALKKISTRRRVVMTGYPLQNNLLEYWCMVDFVRPNFLGTKQEFCNMFERPILNGQCSDSTPSDVRCMRFRAHVLHDLLKGFVQRRSHAVLKKCLPSKQEHVIVVNLSPIQEKLHKKLVQFLQDSVGYINPIKAFHICTKIWNHPDVLYWSLENKKDGKQRESPLTLLDADMELGEPVGVVNSSSATGQGPASRSQQRPSGTSPTDRSQVSISYAYEWAKEAITGYQTDILDNGYKMVLLMEILEQTLGLGEKMLLFSQSLSTLSLIETFLSKRHVPSFPGSKSEPSTWLKNKNYFRLDGNTPPQERERLINNFNAPDNTEVLLFMLSTRYRKTIEGLLGREAAGCLGINLTGASRVVIFDASWNPCHDAQAICRVYRYGQTRACSIYRLISRGTMEKKIYDRQVSKEGVANRVVDEQNPEANFTKQEIMTLICEESETSTDDVTAAAADRFSDPVLAHLCRTCSQYISKVPFKHESLLMEKKELKLTKREKREAKKEYNIEKKAASGGRVPYSHLSTQQPATSRTRPNTVLSSSNKPVVRVRPVQTPVSKTATNPVTYQPTGPLRFPLESLIRAGVQLAPQVAVAPATNLLPTASLNLLPTGVPTQVASNGSGIPTINVEDLVSPTSSTQDSSAKAVSQIATAIPYPQSVYSVLLNQAVSQGVLAPALQNVQGQLPLTMPTNPHLPVSISPQLAGSTADPNTQLLEAFLRQSALQQQQLMHPGGALVQGVAQEAAKSPSPDKK